MRTPPKLEMIKAVCDEIKDTLVAKHQNYGNSAFTPPALAPSVSVYDALMTRLSDKFSRLATLNNGEPDRVGESVQDTIKDIAGYCILALVATDNIAIIEPLPEGIKPVFSEPEPILEL